MRNRNLSIVLWPCLPMISVSELITSIDLKIGSALSVHFHTNAVSMFS